MKLLIFFTIAFCILVTQSLKTHLLQPQYYVFPEESEPHEATWLTWPHVHTYGEGHQNKLQDIWISMTEALATSQKVRIIAYDNFQKQYLTKLLQGIPNIEIFVHKNDDVWIRDNGPIFACSQGFMYIQDWGFNGWGEKTPFQNCDKIPTLLANDLNMFDVVDLNQVMINEGGSVEIDGQGVMMGCRSSILNNNRNPGMTQKQANQIFKTYYGVQKIIWLDGVPGIDVTDFHIDGFVKFVNSTHMLTFTKEDLQYWQVPQSDIIILQNAKNLAGDFYEHIEVPLTKKDVIADSGKVIGKGSYINFYIANKVVLVPNYGDQNDEVANSIIQQCYPDRQVIGIIVNNLYEDGGMIHCVTQQQPKQSVCQQAKYY